MNENEQRIAPPTNKENPEDDKSMPMVKRTVLGVIVLLAICLMITGVVLLNHKQDVPEAEPSVASKETRESPAPSKVKDSSDSEDAEKQTESTSQGGDSQSSSVSEESEKRAEVPAGSNAASKKQPAGSASSQSSTSPQKADTITVTISIDASNAGPSYSSVSVGAKTVTLKKGSDVYDALVATGVAIGGDATYVKSISGLAEMQCGSLSGWMYSVNGVFPNVSCGDYELVGGEVVVWAYTCDLGEDLK